MEKRHLKILIIFSYLATGLLFFAMFFYYKAGQHKIPENVNPEVVAFTVSNSNNDLSSDQSTGTADKTPVSEQMPSTNSYKTYSDKVPSVVDHSHDIDPTNIPKVQTEYDPKTAPPSTAISASTRGTSPPMLYSPPVEVNQTLPELPPEPPELE